jgi:hypothetical protein
VRTPSSHPATKVRAALVQSGGCQLRPDNLRFPPPFGEASETEAGALPKLILLAVAIVFAGCAAAQVSVVPDSIRVWTGTQPPSGSYQQLGAITAKHGGGRPSSRRDDVVCAEGTDADGSGAERCGAKGGSGSVERAKPGAAGSPGPEGRACSVEEQAQPVRRWTTGVRTVPGDRRVPQANRGRVRALRAPASLASPAI